MSDIRVVVVDDHQIVRDGLKALIGALDGLEVVGLAADGRDALHVVEEQQPDVVVELDRSHVETIEANEEITAGAVAGVGMAARRSRRRRLGQRRGPSERVAWSLLILRASTLLTRASRHRRAAHPHWNSEEPEKVLASFPTCPIPEIRRLGRTLKQWRAAFLAYFDTGRASNGGTEAVNGLIELHRRIARGFRNRDNYRLRMLLIGGGLDPVRPT